MGRAPAQEAKPLKPEKAVREGEAARPAVLPLTMTGCPHRAPAAYLYTGQCDTWKRAWRSSPLVGEMCFQYYVFFSVIKMKRWSVGGYLYLAVTALAELWACCADTTPHWCKCRAHLPRPQRCAADWKQCIHQSPCKCVPGKAHVN